MPSRIQLIEGGEALLATALVYLENHKNPLRALCDQGAQVNVISETTVKKMKLKTKPCSSKLIGFNDPIGSRMAEEVNIRVKMKGSLGKMNITCIVVPNFNMNLPDRERSDIQIPTDFDGNLSDINFRIPGAIDLILGSGVMALITENNSIVHQGYRWQDSQLGWLVYGGLQVNMDNDLAINIIQCKNEKLEKLLARFWELDEIPVPRVRSKEEAECERIFEEEHRRLSDGTYEVKIPLKKLINDMGSSRNAALRRFNSLEKRFARDPELKEKYFEEINSLLEAGYMKLADRPPGPISYYLPHHAVSSKFRIVYDGSCKSEKGISINECQLIGERLQDKLLVRLLKFRMNKIAITADVKKMYLQIKVAEEQWDLHRIFWRKEGGEIEEYWLTRVTFGMASAPHCAVRAMQQCALDQQMKYPKAAAVVLNDFYMDDGLFGCHTVNEAVQLIKDLDNLMKAGGFDLRKWQCSISEVLKSIE